MRPRLASLVTAALIGVIVAAAGPAAAADTPVHGHYHADGPWTVEVDAVTYDSGQTGVIYRPVPLHDAGVFPVLVWGNGSGANPEANYPDFLRSIASHGFVIAATDHQEVGTGIELHESLDDLRTRATDPAFVLRDHIDLESVGIFGHSQGAGGSTKAASGTDDFDAVALLALPARPFAFEPEKRFDTADVTAPTLLLAGTLDIPISPTLINLDHYQRLAGPGALAMITGADHFEFANDGGISRGYIIAWFDYLLRGDDTASAAFVGENPEIFRHSALESQATKDLPAPEAGAAPSSSTPVADEQSAEVTQPVADSGTAPAPTESGGAGTLAATGTQVPTSGALALALLALLAWRVGSVRSEPRPQRA